MTDIKALKSKFKDTLRRMDEEIRPELDKEFKKLEGKETYQEKIDKEISAAHSRNK